MFKKQNTKLKWIFSLMIVFIVTGLQLTVVEGSETSIKYHPKSVVYNSNTKIPPKYTFVPQLIRGVTTSRTWGTAGKGWYKTSKYVGGWSLRDPNYSERGKFGFYYEKVGKHKGKWIDLKITVNEWRNYNTQIGGRIISFGIYSINHSSTGFDWIDQTWQYIDHDTGRPQTIEGSYMNIVDYDAWQGTQFSRETVSSINKMYVSNTAWTTYTNEANGELYVKSSLGKASDTADEKAMVTYTFDNVSQIHFKWRMDNAKFASKTKIEPAGYSGGEYFTFLNSKPVPHDTSIPPVKYLSDSDEFDKVSITSSPDEIITAKIHTVVPSEFERNQYSSYSLEDVNTRDPIEILSAKVLNRQGIDVTHKFNRVGSGKFVAIKRYLLENEFYGENYEFIFKYKYKKPSQEYLRNSGDIYLEDIGELRVQGINNAGHASSNKAKAKMPTRQIVVNHIILNKLGTQIYNMKQLKYNKYDGEYYYYKKMADGVTTNGIEFYSDPKITKDSFSGIVRKNEQLNFYYREKEKPKHEVGLDDITIDTNKYNERKYLKASLNINSNNVGSSSDDDAGIYIKIASRKTGKTLVNDFHYMRSIGYSQRFNYSLDATNIPDGDKDTYKVSIVPVGEGFKKGNVLTINTEGYTASKPTLKINSGKNSLVDFGGAKTVNGRFVREGVLRTHASVSSPSISYSYERLKISSPTYQEVKTGYEVPTKYNFAYSSDIPKSSNEISSLSAKDWQLSVSDEIKEATSYEKGLDYYRLAIKGSSVTQTGYSGTLGMKDARTIIEKEGRVGKRGDIYSRNRLQAEDVNTFSNNPNLISEYKIYIPIWIDNLGDYKMVAENKGDSNRIGVHGVSIEITTPIKVYAYMYGTLDSGTLPQDELLLEPIYPDTQTPQGWTNEAKTWLKN